MRVTYKSVRLGFQDLGFLFRCQFFQGEEKSSLQLVPSCNLFELNSYSFSRGGHSCSFILMCALLSFQFGSDPVSIEVNEKIPIDFNGGWNRPFMSYLVIFFAII